VSAFDWDCQTATATWGAFSVICLHHFSGLELSNSFVSDKDLNAQCAATSIPLLWGALETLIDSKPFLWHQILTRHYHQSYTCFITSTQILIHILYSAIGTIWSYQPFCLRVCTHYKKENQHVLQIVIVIVTCIDLPWLFKLISIFQLIQHIQSIPKYDTHKN